MGGVYEGSKDCQQELTYRPIGAVLARLAAKFYRAIFTFRVIVGETLDTPD